MESIEPNNFEDQVKNKMDELKIYPPESTWLNIEKRISNKGKRRKFLLLFFLALCLLTGGYWLLNSGSGFKAISKNQEQEVIREDSQKIRGKMNDSSPTNLKFSDKNNIADFESKAPGKTVGLSGKILKYKTTKGWKKLKSTPADYLFKKRITPDGESNKIKSDEISILEEKSSDSTDDQKKILVKNDHKISSELKKITIQKTGLDTVKENSISEKVFDNPDSELANNKEKNIKEKSKANKNQKNNWQVGLTFSGGVSLVGNAPFGLKNNLTYFSDPMNSGTGSGSFPYYSPSKIRNSISIIGGVFIEKFISEKFHVSFGFNYKYFSTVNKTGFKIDSVQTAYYNSPVGSSTYRNSFHFVEVPAALKVLLNNKKSLPLYWKAGMSISQLLSSNALQFKTNPGVYYIDNSLFIKTQLGFSTGLSVTLMSKQKYPVSIGPEIYYGISGIAHYGLYKKKHFSYIGISAEILFRKK
ncbi:MAG: hypothetical protein ABI168_07820 [Ginsengibacter sp.]